MPFFHGHDHHQTHTPVVHGSEGHSQGPACGGYPHGDHMSTIHNHDGSTTSTWTYGSDSVTGGVAVTQYPGGATTYTGIGNLCFGSALW